MNEKIAEQLEFESSSNNKEHKVENICNNMIYAQYLEADHLSSLYYLIFYKSYPKNKNT